MKRELNPTFYALSITLLIGTIIIHSVEAFDDKLLDQSNQICAVDLRRLMTSLAGKKEKSARFTEEKFLKNLEKPLRSEGTLHFQAPDYLEKITAKPEKERLVVKSELVTIFDQQDVSHTLSLDEYPPLKALLNSIRFVLSGNLNALTKNYELDLKGNCNQWNLILVPISVPALEIIDRIVILGENDNVAKITWVESNGDFTIMTIEKENS
ncbi:MAG: outer membrane lipoprotein carrier protein LolA [Nitrospina sp.]|nr:outer membrane lipoprotein carrier protein LolA [Nitrospina sp.]